MVTVIAKTPVDHFEFIERRGHALRKNTVSRGDNNLQRCQSPALRPVQCSISELRSPGQGLHPPTSKHHQNLLEVG
jgi:hypothetical protein